MKTLNFSNSGLGTIHVDRANSVIRDVAVITSGVTAEGHDLLVDVETLTQMHACAQSKGKVPVKLNHGSGIEAVNGFIDNFRLEGKKLLGDWHLLTSHDETPKMLERAERMPSCFGMSAAFKGEGQIQSSGKKAARCFELKSVDCVTSPAANPDGLFESRVPSAGAGAKMAEALTLLHSKCLTELRSRDVAGQFVQEAPPAPAPATMTAAYGSVITERRARVARILAAFKRGKIIEPEIPPVLSAIDQALILLAEKREKKGLNPYIGAAASGAVSGAILGAVPLLRRGTTVKAGLKSISTAAGLSAGIVGGGSLVGSAILGKPKDDEGAGFTKRAAIGGGIVGSATGLFGGVLATKTKGGKRIVRGLAKTWRPAAVARKSGLPGAVAIGTLAGGAIGAAQGADEGQQVDSLRNIRRDRDKQRASANQPARLALFSAKSALINL